MTCLMAVSPVRRFINGFASIKSKMVRATQLFVVLESAVVALAVL